MRAIFFCITLGSIFSGLASGGGPAGVTPRPRASDYPVHQSTPGATIAAAIVPADQAGKMFSPETAKQYIIVEVAVYPESGATVDLKPLLFTLKVGNRFSNAEQPADVWAGPDRRPALGGESTAVTAESGVAYGRTTGPQGRSTQNLETYSGVAVSNAPAAPVPSSSSPDPAVVADKVWNKALPEGQTAQPVAGYVYFPQYAKKRKSDAVELSYSDSGVSATLLFPNKP
jgi:hypothetical protein